MAKKKSTPRPEPELPETVRIEVEGVQKDVPVAPYVAAITVALRRFGYPDLTQATVREQLRIILSGGKPSVIGMLMVDDIVLPTGDD